MRYTNEQVTAILQDGRTCEGASKVQLALDLRDARAQLEVDARALWAVRVLDRWRLSLSGGVWTMGFRNVCVLKTHCLATQQVETERVFEGRTPDAARIAAAEALVAEDPTLGGAL